MAKPMTLTVEVEEIAFGRVFRTLDTMPGVASIKVHGSGPKAAPAAKGNSGGHKATGSQLVLAALAKGPQSKTTLGALFERNGKKAASVPSSVQDLTKLKHMTSDGRGNYKITAAGRAALKKEGE